MVETSTPRAGEFAHLGELFGLLAVHPWLARPVAPAFTSLGDEKATAHRQDAVTSASPAMRSGQ